MAEEIVKRLRSQEGLADIPIVVGLFKQESRKSIVPGITLQQLLRKKEKHYRVGKPSMKSTSCSRQRQMMKSIVIRTLRFETLNKR